MFKKSKRLIGLCLGVILSLGVGAGLSSVHGEIVRVKAADTKTLTIDGTNNKPKSAWNTSYASSSDGTKYALTSGDSKVYLKYTNVGTMSNTIQIRANTSNGFYSISCLDETYISSVKLVVKTNTATLSMSTNGSSWTTEASVKETTTTSTFTVDQSYKYFKVNATSSYTQITSFVVTYEKEVITDTTT